MITIEGRWAVEAAMQSPFFCVRQLWIEAGRHEALAEQAVGLDLEVERVSRETIAEKAGYDFHRGALAVASRPEPRTLEFDQDNSPTRLVVPAGLGDGGNLGTIIRTAAAFGADGIMTEKGAGADVYSRKCIRASATAIFRIPIYEVESLIVTLARYKESGGVVLGTSLTGDATALPHVRAGRKTAVLLGAEKDGLASELESVCDELVHLPMASGMDSLNVAATASIILYELFARSGQGLANEA